MELTRKERWSIVHGVKPERLSMYTLDDLLDAIIKGVE